MLTELRAVSLGTYLIVALGASLLYYLFLTIQKNAAIRKYGGTRIYSLYSNPITAIPWTLYVMRNVARNTVLQMYETRYGALPPGSMHAFEAQASPGARSIETREPAHIKAVLAGQFADFGKGPLFHQIWRPFLGDSIFTTDGKTWQNSRALIRPMFLTDRVSDLHIFERCTSKMISHIPCSGETIDIMDLFFRMTLDVTTDFLLGSSVNSLDNPHGEFTKAFNDILHHQLKFHILRKLRPLDMLWPRTEYNRYIKTIEDFLTPFIQKTLAMPPEELEKFTKSDKSFTFLHNLAQFTQDPKVIRDQLIAVLLAGRDTTAATLSWVFYELAACPDKVARLRTEVLEFVGKHEAPTYETVKNMKYLRYTLQETLRLHPAVPLNQREVLADTTLPGLNGHPDIGLCKGDNVSYSPLVLHRRRDLYPPTSETFADPSTFSPERWYVWQPRPWEYIPFNGGPRICPGQNFALTEMSYCIVRMLQKFDRIEYRGDWHAQQEQTDVISRPSLGVPVAFFEALDE
ncbi:cytochrome P450 [Biscogniauxia sp. FL1348]|nr:cytochrome P450 [Biscogniauxia sp. FL1348]